jgi:hypothetical protein
VNKRYNMTLKHLPVAVAVGFVVVVPALVVVVALVVVPAFVVVAFVVVAFVVVAAPATH